MKDFLDEFSLFEDLGNGGDISECPHFFVQITGRFFVFVSGEEGEFKPVDQGVKPYRRCFIFVRQNEGSDFVSKQEGLFIGEDSECLFGGILVDVFEMLFYGEVVSVEFPDFSDEVINE